MGALQTIPYDQYQKLPPEKRSRILSDEEYAQLTPSQLTSAGLAAPSEGAPADFGGRILSNPDHIAPHLDTDPVAPVTRLPKGFSFQTETWKGTPKLDVSNPAATEAITPTASEVSAQMGGASSETQTPPAKHGPWEKYSAPAAPAHGPWEKYGAKPAGTTPTKTAPAQEKVPEATFLNTLGREAKAAGSSILNMPGAIYHAAADPATAEEKQKYGENFEHNIGPIGRVIDRSAVQPIEHAIDWYSDAARGKVPNAVDQALSVAPEAIGSAAGNVVGGKILAEAPGTARGIVNGVRNLPETIGPRATAVGKVAAQDAASHIPGVGRLVRRPSVADYVNAARTSGAAKIAPELDATGENQPFAGGTDEYAPKPARILDATGENKPFAGGIDEVTPKPAKILDATGENKPFAGGIDEAPAAQTPKAAAPRAAASAPAQTILSPIEATPAPKAAAVVAPAAEVSTVPEATSDPILSRLRQNAGKIQSEEAAAPKVEAGNEDLTDVLQKSLDQVKARKNGVNTTASPEDLMDRWGVDPESFSEGRAQTRGMKPEESAASIKKLTEAYKNGKAVEPVVEVRDADNNIVEVDGRGRALAAHRAGVERIPVIVRRQSVQR